MRLDHATQIGVLAKHLVRAREVDDDVGTSESHARRRRHRNPQVFANLDAHGHTLEVEEVVGAEADVVVACATQFTERDARPRLDFSARGKPSALVELVVVGQIDLRHYAYHLSVAKENRTVIQAVAVGERSAHNHSHVDAAGSLCQMHDGLDGSIEQRTVVEEVGTGVASERELGEDQKLNTL